TSARNLLAGEIANLSLGKHLSASIRSGHNIYTGEEMLGIKDEGFRVFLAHYFQAKSRVG
ncbi:MAG: CCA tRNA nucleotidyltransferase, partial [Methanothrix sp.]|nr:CCA tRNA nucleotidyltransferase [Methanothrix sp.]